jgi:exodeoxyribonuclease-3
MKIISWNLNGIRSVIKKELFFSFINKELPDIICLQETRATEVQIPLTNEFKKDYPFRYFNSPKFKKGYSGTAIFSKIEPINISYSPFDDQGRIICAEFENYTLINVYVPNSGSNFDYRISEWDRLFYWYLKSFTKKIIVCGDFNVVSSKKLDIYNPKIGNNCGTTYEEMANFELFLKFLIDAFRFKHPNEIKFSWWSNMYHSRQKNHGWRIDYFLTNIIFKDCNILTDVLGSDHAPCFLIF